MSPTSPTEDLAGTNFSRHLHMCAVCAADRRSFWVINGSFADLRRPQHCTKQVVFYARTAASTNCRQPLTGQDALECALIYTHTRAQKGDGTLMQSKHLPSKSTVKRAESSVVGPSVFVIEFRVEVDAGVQILVQLLALVVERCDLAVNLVLGQRRLRGLRRLRLRAR